MCGLYLSKHVGQFIGDDLVINQLLAESLPSVGEFHRFLIANSCESCGLYHVQEPLVIEVLHDVEESFPLLANQILLWHSHIIENHEGCA